MIILITNNGLLSSREIDNIAEMALSDDWMQAGVPYDFEDEELVRVIQNALSKYRYSRIANFEFPENS